MNFKAAIIVPAIAVGLSGCASASWLPSFLQSDPKPVEALAPVVPAPAPVVRTVQIVQPLPLPGQLQPKPHRGRHPVRPPKARVDAANLAALQEPASDG